MATMVLAMMPVATTVQENAKRNGYARLRSGCDAHSAETAFGRDDRISACGQMKREVAR